MNKYTVLSFVLILGACSTILEGESGRCLKWRTMEVVHEKPLPYPMTGTIETIEMRAYCVAREKEDDTALALRRSSIYI